jgi:ankyrin repeat protein
MKNKFRLSLPATALAAAIAFYVAGCQQPQHSQYRDIHAAARAGDLATVEADLTQNPADLELPDDSGFTPLHLAASFCQTNVMGLLLDKGAKPDTKSKDGATPLQLAAQQGCTNGVSLLLMRGATVNVRNNQGKTPLGCAESWHQDGIVNLLRQNGGTE